jgi:hypothetical protein
MVLKRGAPKGNTNRLKHGRFSAAALAQRKLVWNTIRSAKLALLAANVELDSMQAELLDKSR